MKISSAERWFYALVLLLVLFFGLAVGSMYPGLFDFNDNKVKIIHRK